MFHLRRIIPLIGLLFWSQQTAAGLKPPEYHLISSHLSWSDAQSFCRIKYSDLATVNNMADNGELVKALGVHKASSWIGLWKGGTRSWMKTDGGGRAFYFRWRETEPNNAEGDEWCVEMAESGAWNDLSCQEEKGFVCYERQSHASDRYVYHSEKKSWFNSLAECRAKHTDLAHIDSGGQNDKIVKLIKTWHGSVLLPNKVWIGLFTDAWTWSDGGGTSFRNWLSDTESRENCAAVSGRFRGAGLIIGVTRGGRLSVRVVKKMVVRMMIRSEGNLTDSGISDSLLKQFEAELKLKNMTDFTLSWKRDRDGLIFKRQSDAKVNDTGSSPLS